MRVLLSAFDGQLTGTMDVPDTHHLDQPVRMSVPPANHHYANPFEMDVTSITYRVVDFKFNGKFNRPDVGRMGGGWRFAEPIFELEWPK